MKRSIIVLSILLITGCSISKEKLDYIENLSIKIGEEIPNITEYINNYENLKDDIDDLVFDIETTDNKIYNVGTYEGKFKYNDEDISVKLEVIDDESPVIEDIDDITITVGDTIDLLSKVKVTDNSKDDLDIKIIGEYDNNKVGTYDLSVSVIDKGNNESSRDFKLIVKEKPKVVSVSLTTDIDVDLSGTSSKGYEIKRVNGNYYVKDILIANKTYALSSSYNPGGLTSEFNTAFNKMKEAAKEDGVSIWVVSGFRSYSYQTALYNGYVKNYGKASADTFSARAGHSEHQTGLAADLNDISDSFGNTKAGIWLSNNCYKYGFILRYPKGKQSITGYIYEPWHFRYIGDEAVNLYNNGDWITLEEYLGIDSVYAY